MSSTLEVVAAKVSAGERLVEADAEDLVSTSNIISLGVLAEEVRRRRHGDRVTFLRVAPVTLATASAVDPLPASAGEVRLSGVPESIDQAAAAVRALVARVRDVPITAFSLGDLDDLARRAGLSLDVCLGRLKDVGLECVADASLDAQSSFEHLVDSAARAGIGVGRVVFDHAQDDWRDKIHRLVRFQDASQAIRILSPLPRRLNPPAPTTGYEDLKRVAIARLLAGNIPTIQVDWALYGPKLAQVALTFGADDIDNVSAGDEPALGPRRTPLAEVRRNIQAAALVPVERNGRWELLRASAILEPLAKNGLDDDERLGVEIVRRAAEEPTRWIAQNAGLEGSVVTEKVKASKDRYWGFNALTDTYEDLVKAGVIDPVKVVRSALQNSSSIAALLLTTEALISEIPEEKKEAPAMPGGGGMGGMY